MIRFKNIIITLFLLLGLLSYSQSKEKDIYTEINSSNDKEYRIQKTLELVDYYLSKNKRADSILPLTKRIEDYAIKFSNKVLLGESYYRYAMYYYNISEYQQTILYAKQAIISFEEENELYKVALTKLVLGNTYQVLQKNKASLKVFNEAKPNLKKNDLIRLHVGLASVYNQLSNIEKAIYHYNMAYKVAIEIKQTKFLYNIYNGMSIIYEKNNDLEKTVLYLEKALGEAEKSNNYLGQMICYLNLGIKHNDIKEYKSATNYFKKSLALNPNVMNKDVLANVYYNYANTLLKYNKLPKAKFYTKKADSLYTKLNINYRIQQILSLKANIARADQEPKKAIHLLHESIALAKKNEIIFQIPDNYLTLSNIYEETNNIKASFDAYKKYTELKDSIARINKVKEIETLKVQFDISQYENKLQVKDNELSLLEAKRKSANYRNVLLGLLIIGLIFFVYRQQKINNNKRLYIEQEKEIAILKKEQLETKVAFKNNKITEYAIHIEGRNNFLNECKFQIKEIQKLAENTDVRNKSILLQNFISDHIETKNSDVALNKSSDTNTEDFIYNLRDKFSSLTTKEVQVCKLLMLDMSSKKISEKMNISFQTVNNYRASIRKKINLPKGANLKQFIQHNITPK